MSPYDRHEADARRRDTFEAVVQTVVLLAVCALAWWLS
jgi:hypothetical protein